ncbi:MAG TPA: MmgE/PrpD family protein [Steroidobacter sp.]
MKAANPDSACTSIDRLDRRAVLKLLGAGAAAMLGVPACPSRANAAATISERIADYVLRARFEDLPPEVIRKAKEQIVFFFGRAFEVSFLEHGRQMRQVMQPVARERDGASVIGHRLRLAPSDAAFANSTLFGGELAKDDVHMDSTIHSGVITLPAGLSIGEVKRASGRELILAIVLGYEVLGKLGRAAIGWSAVLPRRATNIYGGFGPVTVAGRLLKLDRARMANALGYAAHLCMGLPEGSMMQHYYALISRNGTFAVQLAEAGGMPFSRTTIEGELGLYRSFFGKVPEELPQLIDSLGYSEILGAVQKRYPGTAANTTAIELFADLLERNHLDLADIASVDATVAAKGAPERELEVSSHGPFVPPRKAISSLTYCLARVLLDGGIDPVRLGDESLVDHEDVVGVMRKIRVGFEPGHGTRWARLIVRTIDGRKIERESASFTFPFPPEDWGGWLRASGARLLSDEKLERLEQLITGLEHVHDISKLLDAATPAPGAEPWSSSR